MPNNTTIKKTRRALLTDTLPHEIPLIFSNDKLFASEIDRNQTSNTIKKLLNQLRAPHQNYTVPLSYKIKKGADSHNTLSISHPLHQIQVSEFYALYEKTILSQCSRSPISLRAPYKVLPYLTRNKLSKKKAQRIGIPHIDPVDGRIDVAYSPSVFSYRKYNLLDKFFSSNELTRLENRFPKMKSLDVSRCFFNIYTHSVTWAVKGKEFSKENKGHYSFEQQFDSLMQRGNFQETNGILVGAEISRIFAEIILQKIDLLILADIEKQHIYDGEDYELRRYVDDYFIFYKSDEHEKMISKIITKRLEEFKLYINETKTKKQGRPFVGNVSKAKREIQSIGERIEEITKDKLIPDLLDTGKENKIFILSRAKYSQEFRNLRLTVSSADTGFHNIIGELLKYVQRSVRYLSNLKKADIQENTHKHLLHKIKSLVRILFYAISVDFRANPIYRSHQILEDVAKIREKVPSNLADEINSILVYEFSELLKRQLVDSNDLTFELELLNFCISGSILCGPVFLDQPIMKTFIEAHANKDGQVGYFSFVCLVFICSQNESSLGELRTKILHRAFKRLSTGKGFNFKKNCEDYLLLSDFLSCPYAELDDKNSILKARLNIATPLGAKDMHTLSKHVGFVDWQNSQTSLTLKRKSLQPIYSGI